MTEIEIIDYLDTLDLPDRAKPYIPFVASAALKECPHNMAPEAFAKLIFAVMSRETNYRNILGDAGHGHGLMQIDNRSHGPWLSSHDNGLNPETNILQGAAILSAGINAFPGNLKAGVASYNCGIGGAHKGIVESNDSDSHTTGHDYGADVLRRAAELDLPAPSAV